MDTTSTDHRCSLDLGLSAAFRPEAVPTRDRGRLDQEAGLSPRFMACAAISF